MNITEVMQGAFPHHVKVTTRCVKIVGRHFEWRGEQGEVSVMVKNCSAVGCTNMYKKGNGISFYRFPTNVERKRKWIAAVRWENWMPTKYSWICSQHFVTGKKSNNPLAPNYIPSFFEHVSSPVKCRLEIEAGQFERRQAMKRRRRTAARNATATRRTVSEADTEPSESSTTTDTCTDEDTLTGMIPESPEEATVHSDSSEEMLLAVIQHLL